MAVATYAPPKPTLEPRLPQQDVYEIHIDDSRRNRRLVAAIEIISPFKQRPAESAEFLRRQGGDVAQAERLPTLPNFLKESWAISLDLESSYEETCRTLRIR